MVHTLILPVDADLRVVRRNFQSWEGISVTERTDNVSPDIIGTDIVGTDIARPGTFSRVVRISATNIPALKTEAMMPALYDLVPSFSVTGFPANAEALCRWYRGLWAPAVSDSVELNRLLLGLSGNPALSNQGLNLIRGIYAWITGNIVTDGYYLYGAVPLRQVVDARSATSEQKVRLMKYFLDKLNVKSEILLVRTTDSFNDSVSNLSPAFFNDAVLKLTLETGVYYLDFNSKYFPFGVTGWDKFGAAAMNTATGAFENLPVAAGGSGRVVFSNFITVGSNEELGLSGVRAYEGCFSLYQELFEDLSTRELNATQMENRDIRGISVTNIGFFVPSNGRDGFGYAFGAKIANGLTVRGAETDVPLVCRKANLGETFISRSERSLPLKIYQPLFYSQKLVYRFLPGSSSRISVPEDHGVTNAFGRYSIDYERLPDGTVEVDVDLRLPPQTVAPVDYRAFAEFCAAVDTWEKEEIMFKNK